MVLIGAWVWTPLRDVLLLHVFSLEPDKAAYVAGALLLIPYQPVPMGWRSFAQGFLMNRRRTGIIALASALKTLVLVVPGFLVVNRDPTVNGALLATVLIMAGGSVETRGRGLAGPPPAPRTHGRRARDGPGRRWRLDSPADPRRKRIP